MKYGSLITEELKWDVRENCYEAKQAACPRRDLVPTYPVYPEIGGMTNIISINIGKVSCLKNGNDGNPTTSL